MDSMGLNLGFQEIYIPKPWCKVSFLNFIQGSFFDFIQSYLSILWEEAEEGQNLQIAFVFLNFFRKSNFYTHSSMLTL